MRGSSCAGGRGTPKPCPPCSPRAAPATWIPAECAKPHQRNAYVGGYRAPMLTLRATAAGDLQGVAEWEAEPDTAVWLGGTGHAWHVRALDDPDQEHLIGMDVGVPIGFVVLAGLRAGKMIELRRMVASTAHRGAGRGRGLLMAAVARAYDRHGARGVRLDVKAENGRARALYESAGFAATETRANAVLEPATPLRT